MKKTLFIGAFVSLVVASISASCTNYEDLTRPEIVKGNTVYASYDIDWSEAADSASTAFVKRFYCSEPRNGADGVFSYSAYNANGGNGNCYWQQAHAMTAMIEYYNRIKESNPTEEAILKSYFKRWYNKKGNNYEGNTAWRGTYGFGNVFTDDTCWITITLFKLYEATGEQIYFDAAKKTWDECIWPRNELTKSGWLPWKMDDLGPNECTNGPASIIAGMLANYSREAGDEVAAQEYIRQACICFDQNIAVMASDGTLGSTALSYTQGTCMEAGRLIWHLTGEKGYINKAILAARGQMNSNGMNETFRGDKLMRDEGTDENNSIFHAVLYHWATRMVLDTKIDDVDKKIRAELHTYIRRHASYYWTLGVKKDAAYWEDSYFGVRVHTPGLASSLGAYTSAAQAIESMWIIQDVKF